MLTWRERVGVTANTTGLLLKTLLGSFFAKYFLPSTENKKDGKQKDGKQKRRNRDAHLRGKRFCRGPRDFTRAGACVTKIVVGRTFRMHCQATNTTNATNTTTNSPITTTNTTNTTNTNTATNAAAAITTT